MFHSHSSHDPIETTISIDQETYAQGNKFSHNYTDFKRQRVLWNSTMLPEYQQLAEKALSDAIVTVPWVLNDGKHIN